MLVSVIVTSVVGYLYSCFIGWTPVSWRRYIGNKMKQVWEPLVVSSINDWCLVCSPDVPCTLCTQNAIVLETCFYWVGLLNWVQSSRIRPRPPDRLPVPQRANLQPVSSKKHNPTFRTRIEMSFSPSVSCFETEIVFLSVSFFEMRMGITSLNLGHLDKKESILKKKNENGICCL